MAIVSGGPRELPAQPMDASDRPGERILAREAARGMGRSVVSSLWTGGLQKNEGTENKKLGRDHTVNCLNPPRRSRAKAVGRRDAVFSNEHTKRLVSIMPQTPPVPRLISSFFYFITSEQRFVSPVLNHQPLCWCLLAAALLNVQTNKQTATYIHTQPFCAPYAGDARFAYLHFSI